MEPTVEDLERRMAGLEKSVRRQRVIISGLLLAAVAAVTMAAAPQSRDAEFDVVTARTLIIEDDAGNMMGGMGSDEYGGEVVIKNKIGSVVFKAEADFNTYEGAVYLGGATGYGRTLRPRGADGYGPAPRQ